MTITFNRELLAEAVGRLAPFDAYVLLRLALAVDGRLHEFTGVWDSLADVLNLEPVLVQPVLARLGRAGVLEGSVERTDGVHLHLRKLLSPADALPSNLPVEPI